MLLMSVLSYFVGMIKGVNPNPLLYSCWTLLGTLFGVGALSQLEGFSLFLVRIVKKQNLLITICLVSSGILCLVGGFNGNVSLCVSASLFQYACMIVLSVVYNGSILCLSINSTAVSKAKE